MKVESAKIEGLGEMNHSTAMVLRNMKVKRLILKQFQYAIDFLMHIPGLSNIEIKTHSIHITCR